MTAGGVKGAQAAAIAIRLGRSGEGGAAGRQEVRKRLGAGFGYDLDRTGDGTRPGYRFDETRQRTVREALIRALEAEGFEDAPGNAVGIGGDGAPASVLRSSP